MVTEAQKRASRKWDEKNKEQKRYITYRSRSKTFVNNLATKEDLLELSKLIDKKLNE